MVSGGWSLLKGPNPWETNLTLKDMGFLVSQIHGGGLIQSILEKRSVTPPNFILEQQTESHMKAEVFS